MQLRWVIGISIAIAALAACSTPAQPQNATPLRRMLYVVPEALPRDCAWQIHGEAVTDVVWVGMRLNRKGRLEGAGTVFAAMEKQSTQPPAPALEIHSREKLAHHQLIGLTSTDAGAQILRDAPTRRASQTALLQLLKNSPQVAGLQLDFEYLPPQYAAAFVSYIRELRAALPREKTLHVAAFPPVGMPEAWRGFFDLPELATASDGLVVMLYDYHRPGTVPGCVSGISWLHENVRSLAQLPQEKIWLGAPLYGYHFAGKKTTATGESRFEKRKGRRSEADGCYRIQSAAGETFYPAPALYREYDRLGRENGFAGVAYWRAGLER